MHDSKHYDTSIAGWSFALARGLQSYGLDATRAFADAGIDLESIDSPASRLPISKVQKVWRYAYDHSDECFGIAVSGFLTPGSLHALGFGLYASSTMKELLERLIRYRCVLSHMHFSELLDEGDHYRLSAVDERKIKTNVTHDTLFGFIIRLARQLDQPDFAPLKLNVARKPRADTQKHSDFFAAPVEYDSQDSSILFSRDSLERTLRNGNPELAAQQDRLVEHYIGELGLISEYMLRVKNEISKSLDTGEVSVNRVAENLHVTVRTLQRRLAAEHSSYNDVLDKVREQLAMDYVRDQGLSALDIALKLGFSDSGGLSRSFRRWTGQSLSEYRGR